MGILSTFKCVFFDVGKRYETFTNIILMLTVCKMCKLDRYSSRISFKHGIAHILFYRCDSEIEVHIFLISFPFLLSLLPCCDFQTMSKMQRHQQEALWEFVHTELTYINKLVTIKDVICHSLPAAMVSFKYSVIFHTCQSCKGIFHRKFIKAVSASRSWLLQLLSTCTGMDFYWRSVCGV